MKRLSKKVLNKQLEEETLKTLQARFEKCNQNELKWIEIESRLKNAPEKIWSLSEMERTEGEPSFLYYDKEADEYIFVDFSAESPKGRRSLCYDRMALDARKTHKPTNSALDLANEMGIEILSESDYKKLQEFGEFDQKTSSWVLTPKEIRNKGGAIFCDRRYGKVFTYHNGADSYYGARGFRGKLRV